MSEIIGTKQGVEVKSVDVVEILPAVDGRQLKWFNFAGAGGWDLVCSWFMSEYRFTRRIAWKLTRPGGHYAGLDPKTTKYVLNMPRASYELTGYDRRGRATIAQCGAVSHGGV